MSEGNSRQDTVTQPLQRAGSRYSLHVLGRISVSMLVVGVGLGLTCYLSWIWIEATILPEQGGTEAMIVEGYTPLVYLVVAAVAAPVVAGVVGFVDGRRLATRDDALVVGVGCLIGATLLVVAAGVFIGSTGGGDGGGPGPMDLVGLAGLSAVASAIVGVLTAMLARTNRPRRPALPAGRPEEQSRSSPESERE